MKCESASEVDTLALQNRVHVLCSTSRGLLLQVRVQIGCDSQLAVAEQHRDFDELHTGGQEERRRAVTEIVKAPLWKF